MKKILSVIISVLIVFASLIRMITVSSAASDGADIPVIHVSGYGALLVKKILKVQKKRYILFRFRTAT